MLCGGGLVLQPAFSDCLLFDLLPHFQDFVAAPGRSVFSSGTLLSIVWRRRCTVRQGSAQRT
jgi:hypothetical protein